MSETAIFQVVVQGFWAKENSWWPGSIGAVLRKGYLTLRLDPSPMHPEVTRSERLHDTRFLMDAFACSICANC